LRIFASSKADVLAYDLTATFDARNRRFVLLHLPDPAATSGRLSGRLRPVDLVAFQEYDTPKFATVAARLVSAWTSSAQMPCFTAKATDLNRSAALLR
jgi:hypothetical protein